MTSRKAGTFLVLVFNPGSNSLKFELVNAKVDAWGQRIMSGAVESFGKDATYATQAEAAAHVLDHNKEGIDLIVCRVVHGADLFPKPVRVDADVMAKLEQIEDLAPLHNANSVAILRECLKTDVPAVAVFDSAFHASLPEVAYRYAIDYVLAERHKIRRYGFHGISHKYLMLRYAEMFGLPHNQVNIVTLHLGGGSSACAIQGGQSVDTSMGFTPLEGLMMGTRSGDIDPALVGFLARKEGVDISNIEEWLNRRSGLLGVSGRSQDTRVLANTEDARSKLALEMFAYRVSKYVGAYLAALNGASSIAFCGGIGENAPSVRADVCARLRWFGLDLDSEANASMINREGCISHDGSRLAAYVIPTQESLMMARDAVESLRSELPID